MRAMGELTVICNHMHTYLGCPANLPTASERLSRPYYHLAAPHSPTPLQLNPALPSDAPLRLAKPPTLS